MCKKKKNINVEQTQQPPTKEEFRLRTIADPVFDIDGKRDYFTEYYNVYKNDYIDQYLNYYRLHKKELGEDSEVKIDDLIDTESVRNQDKK